MNINSHISGFDIELTCTIVDGDSGSWVVMNQSVCGYIFTRAKELPWAYMLPIEPVFEDISKVFSLDVPDMITVPSTTRIIVEKATRASKAKPSPTGSTTSLNQGWQRSAYDEVMSSLPEVRRAISPSSASPSVSDCSTLDDLDCKFHGSDHVTQVEAKIESPKPQNIALQTCSMSHVFDINQEYSPLTAQQDMSHSLSSATVYTKNSESERPPAESSKESVHSDDSAVDLFWTAKVLDGKDLDAVDMIGWSPGIYQFPYHSLC